MKKIKPASFCDETVMNLKSEEFVKTQVNRAAPVDPDSGSGSGNVTGVNGSGRGTIQSQIGGSWNATCDFTWTANCTYHKVVDIHGIETFVIDKATISLSVVQLRCEGVPAGTKFSGTYYAPWTFLDSNLIISNNIIEKEVSSGCTEFGVTFHSHPQEFKVSVTNYDSAGEQIGTPTIRTESKIINLDMTFDVSPYFVSPNAINLTLKSCIIS